MKIASNPKYEAPRAVGLSDAQTGVGTNCDSGSSAREYCENGGSPLAERGCTGGSLANARNGVGGLRW